MTDEDNDKLMQAAARLSTGIRPERDLWPDIAEAINRPAPRRGYHWFAQAAAVVLLVAASSAVTYVVVKEEHPTVVQVDTERLFEQASFGNRYNLGPGFQAARDELVSELEVELARLPRESRDTIETNLKLIHNAVYEMNKALAQEPDNVLLQERLLNTYREELALLRRVSGLTRNVMNRNDI